MKNDKFLLLNELLIDKKNIAIIPHSNPDGDAIGSCLGLMHMLNKFGHNTKIISPNSVPNFLTWVPGFKQILFFDQNKYNCREAIANAELIFTLDFNDLSRIGEMNRFVANADAEIILIDHHQNPKEYANLIFSEPHLSSTCELLYEIFLRLGFEKKIDKTISTCIYLGIMTDTGSFKFSGVTSRTHDIVSNLISIGIETSCIHNKVYNNSSESKIKILGRALENLNIISELKTAYMFLEKKDLESLNYEKGDTEGIVNYGLSLSGVNFSTIFIEDPHDEKKIKISFRSIGEFSCDDFAKKHFNGGGHKNAAGGKDHGSIYEVINKFNKFLTNYKTDLSK